MKNLTANGRRLFFSVLIVVGIIIAAGLLAWGIFSIIGYWKDFEITREQKIIKQYELKIDVLNKEGNKLIYKINSLEYQVDSLKAVKTKILLKKYDEKANVIYDASAIEHAKWLDSTLNQLNRSGNYK